MEKITVKDLAGEKGGFKLDYSKLRKAVLQCEIDKKSTECKNAMKDLGIDWIE